MLEKRNINFVLVFVPVTAALYNSFENVDSFDSTMISTTRQYYNFNKSPFLDDSLHFYDAHHLNQLGVDSINRKLSNLIR